jgi:penicillin V acylase-like amidase (Ntn superfamily)
MCTRLFNNRNTSYLTTSRNMDWKTQLPTSLYFYQKGLTKAAITEDDIAAGNKQWSWKSKYSSVVAMVGNSDHGLASSDGINSEGLVANVLYAKKSDYTIDAAKNPKHLNILRWVQYVLDNFATAQEVADAFESNKIVLLEAIVPGSDAAAALHLSVSDLNGDSVIIEAYGGKYHIHNAPIYNVMTNEPSFATQLKLNDYWMWQWSDKNSFPSHTIPGGPFPADRFERAVYYYQQLQAPSSWQNSLAQSRSILANASVPIGMQGFEGHPNIAPTIWTTIADHNNLKYYFSNARLPNVIWVNMTENPPKEDVVALDLVTIDQLTISTKEDGLIETSTIKNHEYDGCVNSLLKERQDPYFTLLEPELAL